ncbi:hypothetical protein FVEN_g8241 [Fusarium venenatum]|uniref:Saccharopine dehydrogenase NADP binding domain-containing protein n=1 Tax=Fusarium venenatum TaxID=56646 RepID=A0A2L2TLE6_9HYPO|nr:uncharacterized protein FVRRES_04391 [Fusarium venenatum]KAG8353897.1 hypothetical protein FVEN_g8241 [Fusarium venenatum]CEI59955.1 unnamed protein product [Fusarium venenatum]
MSSRPYEIIVLGATGWTATICAEHIARAFPINTKWSIAGRSAAKLEALRQSLRIINPDRLEPTVHICSGEMTMLGMRGGSLHTVLDVAENYGVRGWLTVDTYISVVLIHIISKIGILFLAVPWFRSFFRTKSFSPGDGPDRTESRKTESAEWKAVGYVTGVAEPVAFSRFAFQGALVDMAAILAVEAVATINDKLKFKDSNQVKASLSTPSTLGQTFVDRLRTTGFTIEIEGSRNADQMAGTL